MPKMVEFTRDVAIAIARDPVAILSGQTLEFRSEEWWAGTVQSLVLREIYIERDENGAAMIFRVPIAGKEESSGLVRSEWISFGMLPGSGFYRITRVSLPDYVLKEIESDD